MSDSCLFSSEKKKKNRTINLYIQTEHICKGTVQSKLAHSYSKGSAQGDAS